MTPIYRFFNKGTATHFYTSSEVERDSILSSPQFNYEGPSFQAADASANPVFRFFNTQTGTHFYTISAEERNSIQATIPAMNYEGVAYYAHPSPQVGTTPLYRFFNTQTGTHFYTPSSDERQAILSSLPSFNNEGIGYYVLPLESAPPPPPPPPPPTNFEQRVLELTNQERSAAGLDPLTFNTQLDTAADSHTANMALQDFFSHTGQDGSRVVDRAQNAGYNSTFVGENIGVGYQTPEEVVRGWMDSEGHRRNILNPEYTEIGIGYYFLENDTGSENWNHYWTQVFGDRNNIQPPPPPPPPTNFEQRVLELTNQERSAAGLDPLTFNTQLDTAADSHTANMALQDFFSHTGQDGSRPAERAQDAGYSSTFVGENIGVGYQTPEEVVRGWMNSEGHRRNILNPEYTEIGVGYYFLENDTGSENWNHYWTQVFGRSVANNGLSETVRESSRPITDMPEQTSTNATGGTNNPNVTGSTQTQPGTGSNPPSNSELLPPPLTSGVSASVNTQPVPGSSPPSAINVTPRSPRWNRGFVDSLTGQSLEDANTEVEPSNEISSEETSWTISEELPRRTRNIELTPVELEGYESCEVPWIKFEDPIITPTNNQVSLSGSWGGLTTLADMSWYYPDW